MKPEITAFGRSILLHIVARLLRVNVEVDGRSFGPPLRSTDKSETMPLLTEIP